MENTMKVLEITNLCKNYESFSLKEVSFSIEKGSITGFIGRNGAGKSTTLKCLLNLVHLDSGTIRFFGMDFAEYEFEIKQKIGFVSGGINYYPKKKLKTITSVTRNFYKSWDEAAYQKYMKMFLLDENKTPDELSEGMKVKYALTLALSHRAELLILDEPTSGLDPVSRDDLLDVFMELIENEQVTILFSTHITSDLEKCADNIVYIKNGTIIAEDALDDFVGRYKLVSMNREQMPAELQAKLIGCKRERNQFVGLIETDCLPLEENATISDADLESIMIHVEKEGM
jgi:ABC-2 type transport system ATP-binding protein